MIDWLIVSSVQCFIARNSWPYEGKKKKKHEKVCGIKNQTFCMKHKWAQKDAKCCLLFIASNI